MAKLKVYSWAGFVPGSSKQCRVFVAATSRRRVVEILRTVKINNVSEHFLTGYACETGNEHDIAAATEHLGRVVWSELDAPRWDRTYHVVELPTD